MPVVPERTPASIGDRQIHGLATLTIAGIALYTVLDIVAQTLPPHYNPISKPESDLAVGPYGWIMTVNFVVRGLLSATLLLALARALRPSGRSRFGLICLGVWAAGAFLLALFPTDVSGTEHTAHGKIHLAVAIIAFVAVAAAERALSTSFAGDPRWDALRVRATVISSCTTVGLLLFIVAARTPRIGGLIERLFLASALLWMLVVALHLHRESAAAPDTPSRSARLATP